MITNPAHNKESNNRVKSFINKLTERWLKRRIPGAQTHILTSQNVFILPSKFAIGYTLLVCLLFMLATNYQNNNIMLVTYLLISFFLTVMMHSFFNLSKLSFHGRANFECYANGTMLIPITINATKPHFDLNFSLKGNLATSISTKACQLNQIEEGTTTINIEAVISKRGNYHLGRIKVLSEYSFGLFKTWSLLDFNHRVCVYPEPKELTARQINTLSDNQSSLSTQHYATGHDDFYQLKNYMLGESVAHIAWKQFAKGQGKLSKQYQASQGSMLWLKLNDMPSEHIEVQLSYLCYLVNLYSTEQHKFGLDLSNQINSVPLHNLKANALDTSRVMIVQPNSGFDHRQTCLLALAMY